MKPPRRCRWFGHRWGSWRWDHFFEVWHRPCLRRGCIMGDAVRGLPTRTPR